MHYDSRNAILPSNRAMAYLKQKKWKEALADCTLAIKLEKNSVKAYWRRAIANKNLNAYQSAIEDLTHVLSLGVCSQQEELEIENELEELKKNESLEKEDNGKRLQGK